MRESGTVKKYDEARGFGFIRRPNGADVFFHITSVTNATAMRAGDKVSFEVGPGRNDPRVQAMAVQLEEQAGGARP